ncbi:MAG: hypothetical protein FWG40_11360 [Peptococcaceae bacterium]|nr:hypothetical protein [Peptococcaceae bacterium]
MNKVTSGSRDSLLKTHIPGRRINDMLNKLSRYAVIACLLYVTYDVSYSQNQ